MLIKIIEDNNLYELDKGNPLPPVASARAEDKMANVPKSGHYEESEIM
jgi:hypothetical protein